MTAPSTVVSLQRPPPPLAFTTKTEERSRKGTIKERVREFAERRRGLEPESRFLLLVTTARRSEIKVKHGFLQPVCPLPVCAHCYLGAFHSEITAAQGERFRRSHISTSFNGLQCLKEPQGRGGGGVEGTQREREREEVEKTSQNSR